MLFKHVRTLLLNVLFTGFLSEIVNEEALCLNMAVIIIVLIFLSAGVIGFASTSVVLYKKWVQVRDVNRKSEKTGNKEDKRVPLSPHQPVRQFSSPYENHGADSYGF